MMIRPALIHVLSTISALTISTAIASETSPGVAIPSPAGHVPDVLSIDNVAVYIKDLDVDILYTIKNNDKKVTSTNLTIYGPLFGWEGIDSSYPDKAFLELQVKVDQKPVKTKRNAMALYEGELINAKLAHLHIDPLWAARNPDTPLDAAALPDSKLRSAIQEGLIKDIGQGLVPNWYTLASHSWRTSVPPLSKENLMLSYHLRPAYEPLQLNDSRLSSLLNEHCTGTEQLKEQIKALGRPTPDSVVALRYSIPIGLGNTRIPPLISLQLVQDKSWAGLHPLLSFSCKANGEAAIGHPALSQEISSTTDQSVSILVLLPQE